jgi:hypothetical protein
LRGFLRHFAGVFNLCRLFCGSFENCRLIGSHKLTAGVLGGGSFIEEVQNPRKMEKNM